MGCASQTASIGIASLAGPARPQVNYFAFHLSSDATCHTCHPLLRPISAKSPATRHPERSEGSLFAIAPQTTLLAPASRRLLPFVGRLFRCLRSFLPRKDRLPSWSRPSCNNQRYPAGAVLRGVFDGGSLIALLMIGLTGAEKPLVAWQSTLEAIVAPIDPAL